MENFKTLLDLQCGLDCFHEINVVSIKQDEEWTYLNEGNRVLECILEMPGLPETGGSEACAKGDLYSCLLLFEDKAPCENGGSSKDKCW